MAETTSNRSKSLEYVRRYYPDCVKVIDAKRGTKITVKPQDCANGVGKAPNICAIAKAAMRHYDGAIISLSRAYLIKGNVAHRYEVPNHVTRELIVFDRSHQFQPGVYRLEKIGKDRQLGMRGKPGPGAGRRPSKKKLKHPKHFTGGVRSLSRHES